MGIDFAESVSSADSSIVYSDTLSNQEVTLSIVDNSKVLVLYQDLSKIGNE